MSGRRRWALVGAALAIVAVATLVSARGAGAPASPEERAHAVAAELRCPVCQNLSVADSPSRLAGEMRSEIETQLRAGRTEDEVRAFFVARYGEWVLLEPTRSGWNLVPWLFPIVAVLVGVLLWAAVIRRRARPTAPPVSDVDRARIERELRALEDLP